MSARSTPDPGPSTVAVTEGGRADAETLPGGSEAAEDAEAATDAPVPPASKRRRLAARNNINHPPAPSPSAPTTLAPHVLSTAPPRLMRSLPLLVCSIGNPGATYAHTLHSAGHTLLARLAAHLDYPDFHKERALGNGAVSYPTTSPDLSEGDSGSGGGGGDWTLWQSPAYMNDSGKAVRAAYQAWSRNLAADGAGRLVVVHDELEKPLGAVSLRTAAGASAKGHNGLKSIMAAMTGTATPAFARIGIGIGRPASRQSDDVARYVLRKMTPAERVAIEAAVEQVIAKLRELER